EIILILISDSAAHEISWEGLVELHGRDVKKWKHNCDYGLEHCLDSFCSDVEFQEKFISGGKISMSVLEGYE
ncbi:hypothetical protein LINPERPRIM_LOCUS41030, partial [Linum perenne]